MPGRAESCEEIKGDTSAQTKQAEVSSEKRDGKLEVGHIVRVNMEKRDRNEESRQRQRKHYSL